MAPIIKASGIGAHLVDLNRVERVTDSISHKNNNMSHITIDMFVYY